MVRGITCFSGTFGKDSVSVVCCSLAAPCSFSSPSRCSTSFETSVFSLSWESTGNRSASAVEGADLDMAPNRNMKSDCGGCRRDAVSFSDMTGPVQEDAQGTKG